MPKLAIFYQQIIPLIPSLKKNYFNPLNFFDDIHIFTFDRKLTNEHRSATLHAFGQETVTFHPIGGFNLHNVYYKRVAIANMIKEISPDVIRAYSPLTDGYLATYTGHKTGIPSVISVHGDKDRDNRYNILKQRRYGQYLASLIYKNTFEKPSLRKAKHIIAVYDFAADYARRYSDSPVTVIYNKVDTEIFSPGCKKKDGPFTIINVGRFIAEKNQEILIRAMQNIDGKLVLVGKGETLAKMKKLAKDLDLDEKIAWYTSLKNDELVGHFRSADAYATAIRYGGIAIPVMEAMACGLPIVQCPPPCKEKLELVGDAALVVDENPESFAAGINRLKEDRILYQRKSASARQILLSHNSRAMDTREVDVYRRVIHENSNR